MKNKRRAKKICSALKLCTSAMLIAAICLTCGIAVFAEPIRDNGGSKIDLGLKCRSAILVEASSGTVIYEQNADEALPPASVTKIMTLLLVMEAIEKGNISYTDTVRASSNACSMGGSQIYLEENEEMTVDELIKSVVIASANDAAVALAEHISGTEKAFVEQMNRRADELGMKNTFFENTNGLDDTVERHLTSARDIAIMSRELIKHKRIIEYSSIWMDSIRGGEFGLTNTNRLIRFYKGANGLKTGSTAKAGFCISATAERDGMTLIAVIMGAESRDIRNSAAVSLLDHGFSNYGIYKNEGITVNDIALAKGRNPSVKLEYKGFSCPLAKSAIKGITVRTELPEKLVAPINKGDVVGQIIYLSGEREIGRSDIIATESVEKMTFWLMIAEFLKNLAIYL